ncbi:MAG: NADPH-dependent FMN reductase [Minwuia sp.]|uniref:NADPH-dependent FMN reductase n=1 Tax=Minwuia sp. TaxID=2493630 RepID=UPI003A8BA715
MKARILGFAGSIRGASVNRVMAKTALDGAAAAGAEVTWLELADYQLPLYNGDLEANEGFPDNVVALKDIFDAHDGFVIGCPEYNSSITPLLKNTIDWVSRPIEGQPPLHAFTGKVAGLVAGSGGALGGLRGLVHVRAILGNIGTIVVPQQRAVSGAPGHIKNGEVIEDEIRESLELVGKKTAQLAAAMKG